MGGIPVLISDPGRAVTRTVLLSAGILFCREGSVEGDDHDDDDGIYGCLLRGGIFGLEIFAVHDRAPAFGRPLPPKIPRQRRSEKHTKILASTCL
jgi:hypothetical protein